MYTNLQPMSAVRGAGRPQGVLVMERMNYLGLPAGVVPVGLVEGLPAGAQIVGRRFREDLILDAMATVEAQVGVLARTLWSRER